MAPNNDNIIDEECSEYEKLRERNIEQIRKSFPPEWKNKLANLKQEIVGKRKPVKPPGKSDATNEVRKSLRQSLKMNNFTQTATKVIKFTNICKTF
jgi:hypothetical protein